MGEYAVRDLKAEYKTSAKKKLGELLKTHLRNVYDLAGGGAAFSNKKYERLFDDYKKPGGSINFEGFNKVVNDCRIDIISPRTNFKEDATGDSMDLDAFNSAMKKLETVGDWRHVMDQKDEQKNARFAKVLDVVKELSKIHTTKEGLPSILNRTAEDLIE